MVVMEMTFMVNECLAYEYTIAVDAQQNKHICVNNPVINGNVRGPNIRRSSVKCFTSCFCVIHKFNCINPTMTKHNADNEEINDNTEKNIKVSLV